MINYKIINFDNRFNQYVFALFLIISIYVTISYWSIYIVLSNSHVTRTITLSKQAPTFFVCTHDFQHIDLFAIQQESFKWYKETGRKTIIVVADRLHNYIYDMVCMKAAKCMFATSNTTVKMLKYLEDGNNVCIFLYRNTTGRGVHYVLESWKGPCVLVQIKNNYTNPCKEDITRIKEALICIANTAGRLYDIKYTNYIHKKNLDPQKSMKRIKKYLYYNKKDYKLILYPKCICNFEYDKQLYTFLYKIYTYIT